MKNVPLSIVEQSVLNALKKEHLTSFEILHKLENVELILSVYTIIDKLKNEGIINSYIKEDKKYHYAA